MPSWVCPQILRQFGELPADLAERQRYAAWKVADIRKALREGRTPTAGNPNGADMNSLSSAGALPCASCSVHLLTLGRPSCCARMMHLRSWR